MGTKKRGGLWKEGGVALEGYGGRGKEWGLISGHERKGQFFDKMARRQDGKRGEGSDNAMESRLRRDWRKVPAKLTMSIANFDGGEKGRR